jgi:predicted SprT family Zn-dependent metalloprotease
MELAQARQLAINHMVKHGLINLGWRFEFDSAKRRFGVCKHRAKVIGLSKHLVELNTEVEVNDVILHEIAHALVGKGHGHDFVWKRKAAEIGAKPERCYDDTVAVPKGNYTAICANGHEHARFKAPKKKQSCGLCSRRFDERFLLVWKKDGE